MRLPVVLPSSRSSQRSMDTPRSMQDMRHPDASPSAGRYLTSRNVRDVATILEKYMRSSPLLVATLKNDVDEVRRLVDNGIEDVNCRDPFGNTPLHVAAHRGHCALAKVLIRRRCAIDGENNDGWTPLHFACLQSDVEMVRTLVKVGADVDARDIALRTPLHVVSHTGRAAETVKILLRAGALLDPRSANNITPLLLCCEFNDRTAALLLASCGASVTNTHSLDRGGRTPEGWAAKHGWAKQLLRSALAPGRPLAPIVTRVEGKCIGVKWLLPYIENADATLVDTHAYKTNGGNIDAFEIQTGYVPRSAKLGGSSMCRFPFSIPAPSVMSGSIAAPTSRSAFSLASNALSTGRNSFGNASTVDNRSVAFLRTENGTRSVDGGGGRDGGTATPRTSRSALSEESASRLSAHEQARSKMLSRSSSRGGAIDASLLTRRVGTPGLIAWREKLRLKHADWQTADAGMALVHTFWKLKHGHRVAFRVRAHSKCGEKWGEWSDASDSAMLVGPPSDASSPRLVSRDKTTLSVEWDRPRGNGAGVDGHELQIALASIYGLNPWVTVCVVDCRGRRVEQTCAVRVCCLRPNTHYRFRVRAVNKAGWGGYGLPSENCLTDGLDISWRGCQDSVREMLRKNQWLLARDTFNNWLVTQRSRGATMLGDVPTVPLKMVRAQGLPCLTLRCEQARQRVAGSVRFRTAAEDALREPYPCWQSANVPDTFLGFWTPPRHMELDLGDIGSAPIDRYASGDAAAEGTAGSPLGSPKKSNIDAGVTFAQCCYAHGPALLAADESTPCTVGVETSFSIQACDQFDIAQTHMGDVFQVAMVPMPRSGFSVEPIGMSGGTYTVAFTPHYASDHMISIRLVGRAIKGSPFNVHVVEGATKEEHTWANRASWQQNEAAVAAKRAPANVRTTALWEASSTAIKKGP